MSAQVCTSTALYIGAALIVTTSISTLFLNKAGLSPTLAILSVFLIICLCLSRKVVNMKGRMALAGSGVFGALMCHYMLAWFINFSI